MASGTPSSPARARTSAIDSAMGRGDGGSSNQGAGRGNGQGAERGAGQGINSENPHMMDVCIRNHIAAQCWIKNYAPMLSGKLPSWSSSNEMDWRLMDGGRLYLPKNAATKKTSLSATGNKRQDRKQITMIKRGINTWPLMPKIWWR